MKLAPYIFFYGRCEEALAFYKGVFGGTYEMMRVSETPMADQMPPGSANKVMHAKFTAGDLELMCSDGDSEKPINPDEGNVSLAVDSPNGADAERVFKGLSDGGTVKMPLSPAFWGGRFGMVVDRFGNEWMLTTP